MIPVFTVKVQTLASTENTIEFGKTAMEDGSKKQEKRLFPEKNREKQGRTGERRVRSGLHPPPRSPMRTDVSRSLTNSPQFAGLCLSMLMARLEGRLPIF
jgi:hypothetical protein